jgi:hypothetical protein
MLDDTTRCPSCGYKALSIVYGYPTAKVLEAAWRREIVAGGIYVEPDYPACFCGWCNKLFGSISILNKKDR